MTRFGGSKGRRLKKLREEAYIEQGGLCYYCGKLMSTDINTKRKMRCTAEHLIPVRKNGLTVKENIVAAHQICNQRRDKKI